MTLTDCVDESMPALTAREVCQVLHEITFGRRRMIWLGEALWDEVYAGHFQVAIDGWWVSIYNDCGKLA